MTTKEAIEALKKKSRVALMQIIDSQRAAQMAGQSINRDYLAAAIQEFHLAQSLRLDDRTNV